MQNLYKIQKLMKTDRYNLQLVLPPNRKFWKLNIYIFIFEIENWNIFRELTASLTLIFSWKSFSSCHYEISISNWPVWSRMESSTNCHCGERHQRAREHQSAQMMRSSRAVHDANLRPNYNAAIHYHGYTGKCLLTPLYRLVDVSLNWRRFMAQF